jgi:hypothetical protein
MSIGPRVPGGPQDVVCSMTRSRENVGASMLAHLPGWPNPSVTAARPTVNPTCLLARSSTFLFRRSDAVCMLAA